MTANDYLYFIVNEIHSTVAATVDDNGLPITCAIDMMYADDNGLYFLTAKGKGFYDRLIKRKYISLTGIKGTDTMSCTAVSVRGKTKETGGAMLSLLFEKNPYMNDIYPTEQSRTALTVFNIFEGTGEWFDLSKKPVERAHFAFGGAEEISEGYFVTDRRIGCKFCYSKCPQKCIDIYRKPVIIKQENCLHCGNCFDICPVRAIEKRG